MICLHIYISGIVQGVGMRYFVKTNAEYMGLSGWVRNTDDGRVEILAQGDRKILEKFIKKCEKGSHYSQVDYVEVVEVSCVNVDLKSGFEIKY